MGCFAHLGAVESPYIHAESSGGEPGLAGAVQIEAENQQRRQAILTDSPARRQRTTYPRQAGLGPGLTCAHGDLGRLQNSFTAPSKSARVHGLSSVAAG
jgi:hypothetical protein